MRICIACGKTDDEVYFGKKTKRASGYTHTPKRCSRCVYRLRRRAKPYTQSNRAKVHFKRSTVAEVVSCPKNEYQGTFYGGDFKDTLRAGYWTLGMIVRIDDKKYAVCGNGLVMKTMKRLGYPADVKLPAQWLAEVTQEAWDDLGSQSAG